MYALHCGRYYISCFFALLYFLFLPLFYILFFFFSIFFLRPVLRNGTAF